MDSVLRGLRVLCPPCITKSTKGSFEYAAATSIPHGRPVPDMDLGRLGIPVLAAHHERDRCKLCDFVPMPRLMKKLGMVPRRELIAFKGGEDRGDP